jgi:hypothetical protein
MYKDLQRLQKSWPVSTFDNFRKHVSFNFNDFSHATLDLNRGELGITALSSAECEKNPQV